MTRFTVDYKLQCYIPIEVEAETPEEARQKAEVIAMGVWDELDHIWDGRDTPHCHVGFDELSHLQTMTDEEIVEIA